VELAQKLWQEFSFGSSNITPTSHVFNTTHYRHSHCGLLYKHEWNSWS